VGELHYDLLDSVEQWSLVVNEIRELSSRTSFHNSRTVFQNDVRSVK
jgi:hypothetical protein